MTRQKILITGASSGPGAGMARAFAVNDHDQVPKVFRANRCAPTTPTVRSTVSVIEPGYIESETTVKS